MTDTARSIRSDISFALILGGLVALASLSQQGDGDQQMTASEKEYCEMTALFEQDGRNGFAEDDRIGWPDFHGNAASLCTPQITHGQQLASR